MVYPHALVLRPHNKPRALLDALTPDSFLSKGDYEEIVKTFWEINSLVTKENIERFKEKSRGLPFLGIRCIYLLWEQVPKYVKTARTVASLSKS